MHTRATRDEQSLGRCCPFPLVQRTLQLVQLLRLRLGLIALPAESRLTSDGVQSVSDDDK